MDQLEFDVIGRIRENYLELFEALSSPNLSDLKYVVSCIMIHDVEYSSHFLFTFALSQYMKENSILPDFSRYEFPISLLFCSWPKDDNVPSLQSGSKLQLPCVSYEIFPENFDFKYIFKSSSEADEFWISFKEDIDILQNLLSYAVTIYPPKDFPVETDDDIKAIRLFYEQDFSILETCKRMFLKASAFFKGDSLGSAHLKEDDLSYNYVRALFEFILELSEEHAYSPGHQPRDLVRQSLKESRAKKTKST